MSAPVQPLDPVWYPFAVAQVKANLEARWLHPMYIATTRLVPQLTEEQLAGIHKQIDEQMFPKRKTA